MSGNLVFSYSEGRPDVHRCVLLCLLSIITSFILFFRGELFGFPVLPVFIVSLLLLSLLLIIASGGRFGAVPLFLTFLSVLVFTIGPVGIAHTDPIFAREAAMFWAEMMFQILVGIAYYHAVKRYRFKLVEAATRIALISFIAYVALKFLGLVGDINIRRLAGIDDPLQLGVAVNHLGHSLVMAIMIITASHFYSSEKKTLRQHAVFLVLLILSAFMILATGSKAAIFGLVSGFGCMGLLNIRSTFSRRAVRRAMIGFFMMLPVAWLALPSFEEFFAGAGRISWEKTWGSLDARIGLWSGAVAEVDGLKDVILGQPHRYEPLGGRDYILYPHGFVPSTIVHMGAFQALFVIGLASFGILLVFLDGKLTRGEKSLVVALWLVVVLYSSTSGRLTRILTIPMLVGMTYGIIASPLIPGPVVRLARIVEGR